MDVQERNDTRIYALSNGPSLPEWIGERARRNLSKRDSSIRRRIELLQDFGMPASSSKIMTSKDGRFIMAAGTYSPRIRCYELSEMSMKFERYVDAEVVDMLFLGEDYGKLAILQNNRSVLFHAPYGQHTTLRIPTFGRGMAYEPTTCELLIACSGKAGRNSVSRTLGGGEVYRINLEEGRFSAPLNYTASTKSSKNGASAPVVGGSCIGISPTHALTALGGDDGIVRFWDNRIPPSSGPDDLNLNPFCHLDVKSSTTGFGFYDESTMLLNSNSSEITSLAFDQSGMQMAAGTFGGNVALYDIRSSKPLHVKEHQYGLPIHTIRFHTESGTILSGDSKLIKVWRSKPSSRNNDSIQALDEQAFDSSSSSGSSIGSIVANIEGSSNFNHFIVAGDEKDPTGNSSGMVLCAGEQPKMQAFYCPVLGSAPQWCSFLDNITEELEERDRTTSDGKETSADLDGQAGGSIYEDYKFLTRAEIDSLGIQNLVGTPLLRGYMHGFFIDIGLYNRVRAVANPFEYEEYRKKKIRDKMEEKRASRIAPKKSKKQPKVNKELAERLETKVATGGKSKSSKIAKSLIDDDRFGSLFENPDYQIDEEDFNFKLRNPSGVSEKKPDTRDFDMDSDADDNEDDEDDNAVGFHKVVDDDNDQWSKNDDDDDESVAYDSDSDEDGFRGSKVRGENYDEMKDLNKKLAASSKKKTKKDKSKSKKDKKKKKKGITMYETDEHIASGDKAMKLGLGNANSAQLAKAHKEAIGMSVEERLRRQEEQSNDMSNLQTLKVRGEGASREVTFIPRGSKKKMEAQPDLDETDGKRKRKRRGIKDLGFKTPFKHKP